MSASNGHELDRERFDLSWLRRMLWRHASRDPERQVLHGVYVNETHFVSTDGRRAFLVRRETAHDIATEHVAAGDTLYPPPLGRDGTVARLTQLVAYPDVAKALPRAATRTATFRMAVPAWVKKHARAARDDSGVDYAVTLNIYGSSASLALGYLIGTAAQQVVFNLAFLAAFACRGHLFYATHGETSPIIIAPTLEGAQDPLSSAWAAVVMPLTPGSARTEFFVPELVDAGAGQ